MWKSHEKYTPYEGMSEKNKVIADAIRRRAETHDNVFDGALMYCFNGMMWHEDFIVGTKVIDSEDVIETMDKKALDAAVKKIESKATEEQIAIYFDKVAEKCGVKPKTPRKVKDD